MRRLLARLLDNVLTNGARHGREGGRLIVEGVAEPGPPGWHSGRVRLRIRNEGSAIPAEEWERIFEPFARLGADSNRTAGFGLGLAISREVARLHGGDICVRESTPLFTSFEVVPPEVRPRSPSGPESLLLRQTPTPLMAVQLFSWFREFS